MAVGEFCFQEQNRDASRAPVEGGAPKGGGGVKKSHTNRYNKVFFKIITKSIS
jgi:hypothetical protein